MDRSALEAAYQLGVTAGRREAFARLAADLRGAAARWRTEEGRVTRLRDGIRAALAWRLTERWCGRVEQTAQRLETESAQLGTAEQTQRAAFERVLAPKRRWLPWG